jgi:hypothetical protein
MGMFADTSKLASYTRSCVDITGTCSLSTNLHVDVGVRSV